jgi:lipoate-protein ligase A
MNMAVDEAILEARILNKVPNTLRFYRWLPSAVSIGYAQDPAKEADLEACKVHGVDVVRRPTGGGAVYHDSEGEITYSVTVDEQTLGSSDQLLIYNKLCSGIIKALGKLGAQANFDEGTSTRCPNILLTDKKVSGSAQLRRRGVILQHGTILMDLDFQKMFTFLKVPWARNIEQVIPVMRRKLTSIHLAVNPKTSENEILEALAQGFSEALNAEFTEASLTSLETETAKRLYKKYRSDGWNSHRRFDEVT